MMNILRDQRSSTMPQHAAVATLGVVALAVLAAAAVGIVVGLGAVDLYETANGWVLRA